MEPPKPTCHQVDSVFSHLVKREWEIAERRKMRCIWMTRQSGISEQEAAVAIILEIRKLVENDRGVAGVQNTFKGQR